MDFKLKKSNLNFKVYTVEAKPTAPGAENDIAVISSVPMTNWFLSPEDPSGIPRNDGDVWIKYSVKGDTLFNALKQNALMIATISAWQYVDSAWVDREAVSCQNGVWVDWLSELYLYNTGDECTAITGGWGTKSNAGYTATITKNAASIKIYSATSEASGLMVMKNTDPIDLTKFRTMLIVVLEKTGTNSCAFGLVKNYSFSDFTSAWIAKKTIAGKGTYELEIPIELSEGLPLIQVGPRSSITFEILLLK